MLLYPVHEALSLKRQGALTVPIAHQVKAWFMILVPEVFSSVCFGQQLTFAL